MFSPAKKVQIQESERPIDLKTKGIPVEMIERRKFVRPLPQPDVQEGNEASDWALWESLARYPSQQ